MEEHRQERLLRAAPNFYRLNTPYPTPFSERGGFECGDGWGSILFRLGYLVEAALRHQPAEKRELCFVEQVKEKFGILCIHMGVALPNIDALIEEAVAESEGTCETCGAAGKKMQPRTMIFVMCPTHRARFDSEGPMGRWRTVPHAWEVATVDGGHIGPGRFFLCRTCGASGGPVLGQGSVPRWQPFLAGFGSDPPISLDCEEAKRQIAILRAGVAKRHGVPSP